MIPISRFWFWLVWVSVGLIGLLWRCCCCAELVERLEKHSGMGVAAAVVSVLFQAPWSKCHGPLHMAAAAGKVDACKYLIWKLKLDVSAAGTDGS